MKKPDVIECEDDILRDWAYHLESMDLPCSECPVYFICLSLDIRDSCYASLKYAISFARKQHRRITIENEKQRKKVDTK